MVTYEAVVERIVTATQQKELESDMVQLMKDITRCGVTKHTYQDFHDRYMDISIRRRKIQFLNEESIDMLYEIDQQISIYQNKQNT